MSTNVKIAIKCSILVGIAVVSRQRFLRAQSQKANSKQESQKSNTIWIAGQPLSNVSLPTIAELARIEFAVSMHCEACVSAVRSALASVPGTESIHIDLGTETVIVQGSGKTADYLNALQSTGRASRLIGIGGNNPTSIVPDEVGTSEEWSAAVAEFKGRQYNHSTVVGVVRLVQTAANGCLIEAQLEGLVPRASYEIAIHEYGDIRSIPKTTGNKINALGTYQADGSGYLQCRDSATLKVWEVIGRSIVLYENGLPLVGTVIARSAAVGANTAKRLCTCDGTVIWDGN